VSYPDFMDRIVPTSGIAKTYGHGIVRLEGEIAALTADENFKGGDYTAEPEKGIEAFSIVWTGWLFSQEWWRKELWRSDEPKAPRSLRWWSTTGTTSSREQMPTTSSSRCAAGRVTTWVTLRHFTTT
jgi:homoserine acetyltransferase